MPILVFAPLQSWAQYAQTFDVNDAVPMNIEHYRSSGRTSQTWNSQFLLISTEQWVAMSLRCIDNTFIRAGYKRLRVQTSYTQGYDETNLQTFEAPTPSEQTCIGLVAKVLQNPKNYVVRIYPPKLVEIIDKTQSK